MRTLTNADVVYTFTAEPEYDAPEEHFCADDAEFNAKLCADIRRRAEWCEWAWCTVRCRCALKADHALYEDDYLGACSYDNADDFLANSGFADDMQAEAFARLQARVDVLFAALA